MRITRSMLPLVAFVLSIGGEAKDCFAADPPADLSGTSTADVERCVDVHDKARVLMLEEKWFEAREGLTVCQDESCPLAVRSDCVAWLEEVTRALPTLLVVVERDDDGTAPVALEIDGKTLPLANPPAPIEVMPGSHVVRVRLAPYPLVERTVEVKKGEKNHVVRVRFAREPAPAPVARTPASPDPELERPIPPVTYALAGGAVAAFATSGILLASALTSRDEATDRCAPVCTDDERQSIDSRLLAADLIGVAGIVLGGLSAYTFFTRPTVERTGFVPKLEVSSAGSRASITGRF